MFREYLDELILMVVVTILLAVIDTLLFFIKVDKEKKDQFMKWFNIVGIAIILTVAFRQLILFLTEIQHFLQRL